MLSVLRALLLAAATAAVLCGSAAAVDHAKFKTCAQSGFCRRLRAAARLVESSDGGVEPPLYAVHPDSVDTTGAALTARINGPPGAVNLVVQPLASGAVRVRVAGLVDPRPKWDAAALALPHPPAPAAFEARYGDGGVTLTYAQGAELRLQYRPLRLELWAAGRAAVVLNGRGLFRFESGLENKNGTGDAWDQVDRDGAFEENFHEHADSKPYGPRAFGFDTTFPDTAHVYGLAEHATDFNLPSTRGPGARYEEPYRLYNLDVFEYILDSPMALYGSVPLLLGQGTNGAAGVLVLSSSEMWVDIERGDDQGTMAHWMAESNPMDVVLFAGPNVADVHQQYMRLSGFPALPPLFSVAYHQCRWNYNDQDDVAQVDAGFDQHEIPYDVLWLDIEHTDEKRYFTWDARKFPDPKHMIDSLASRHRKMVTIIDPHLKRDDGFPVLKQAADQNLLVKNKDGAQFSGWCWPGDSQWLDYTATKAREYWASLFDLDKYKGSTLDLYTWNDMNEPSVFTGPEITMPKDNLHDNNVEHRDVHNLYGLLQHRASVEGQLRRSLKAVGEANPYAVARPFVLSRAFYVGTQRFGAIWTGDNMATWPAMNSTVPMVLAVGASGIPFAGADTGGFFGNPEPELLVRWYQAGAMQPFFRAHAHIDTKRREPWLFGEPYVSLIRDAVMRRYRYMPMVYTAFYDAWRYGKLVARPTAWEFPEDRNTWAQDEVFMLGPSGILVAPVNSPGQASASVYLPMSGTLWYLVGGTGTTLPSDATWTPMRGGQVHDVSTPLDTLPVFARAGSVHFTRERPRRASTPALTDPITLTVLLDARGRATGHMVFDDGSTFEHLVGAAVEAVVTVIDGTLSAQLGAPAAAALDRDAVGTEVSGATTVAHARAAPPDAAARARFMQTFGAVRVERVVFVYPTAPAPAPTAARTRKGKKLPVAPAGKSGRVFEVKEPGFTFADEQWELSFGAF